MCTRCAAQRAPSTRTYFAKDHLNAAAFLSYGMSAITPLNALGMLTDLKQQLPRYLATTAANAPAFDKGSVTDYTDAILGWWYGLPVIGPCNYRHVITAVITVITAPVFQLPVIGHARGVVC